MVKRARLICFYLPQFHPIPENDRWWGAGFTEWTHVTRSKPLFKGHSQPNLPADLGFYDLRLPEARQAQAELARLGGIEAFCYWHYWFGGGEQLLQRPLSEVVASGSPDFPFCVAWANESWTGRWHGLDSTVLKEQTYPSLSDIFEHASYLMSLFLDDRYLRINSRPLLLIYRPYRIPNAHMYFEILRNKAISHGIPDLCILGFSDGLAYESSEYGLDGIVLSPFSKILSNETPLELSVSTNAPSNESGGDRTSKLQVYQYEDAIKAWRIKDALSSNAYPVVFPNWDNSPRLGVNGIIIKDSNPSLWGEHLNEAIECVEERRPEERLVFIKSWNEWAEGNYLEPDQKHGRDYINMTRYVLEGQYKKRQQ